MKSIPALILAASHCGLLISDFGLLEDGTRTRPQQSFFHGDAATSPSALNPQSAICNPQLLQGDPLAAAKKDLGSAFSVERIEPGILLATPGNEGDAAPQNSLLVIVYGSAESYKAYTSQRYPGGIPQTIYYDVLNRRVLLRSEAGRA